MDTITIVCAIVQATLAAATLATIFSKPVRDLWKRNKQKEALNDETYKCLLRSEITRIYYANKDGQAIRSYDYENVSMLYASYKARGGNSYVDKIWDEIRTWDLIV